MLALPKAMGTDVQHPGPIDDVVLEVGAGAIVEALARLELLLGLWLVPCLVELAGRLKSFAWMASSLAISSWAALMVSLAAAFSHLSCLCSTINRICLWVERTRCQGADDVSLII